MGKASGAALILAGVVVLIGGYLLPHRGNHESAPMQGGIEDAPSRQTGMGSWRLSRVKPEEAVVVTLPPHAGPPTMPALAIPRDKAALHESCNQG